MNDFEFKFVIVKVFDSLNNRNMQTSLMITMTGSTLITESEKQHLGFS